MTSFHKTFMVIASVLCLLLINLSGTQSQFAPLSLYHFCTSGTTYTPNSTFQSNLKTVLSSLSSNATRNEGFYNSSAGRVSPDIAYGLSLCRGDVGSDVCQACVLKASTEIVERCPDAKKAVIWYPECMLRYADRSFYSTMEDEPRISMLNTVDIPEQARFQQLVENTMKDLATRASSNQQLSSNDQYIKGFATQMANFTSTRQLYGLVQCTPDLCGANCNSCLQVAIAGLPECCYGKQGGRVLIPSCNLRYEVYPFYNLTNVPPSPTPAIPSRPPPPGPSSLPKPQGNDDHKTQTIIIVTVVLTIGLAILVCLYICTRNRKLKDKNNGLYDDIGSAESLQFDFDTIKVATQFFSDSNKLGQGGFGAVYKGKLLDGREIAVKRLSKTSGQGELEFKNEASLLAKLQHKSLVRLLGYSLKGTERLLIYEFVPNGSLDNFIFGNENVAGTSRGTE